MDIKKNCVRCGRTKTTNNFNRHSTARDGLQPYCKKCQAEDSRQRNAAKMSQPKLVMPGQPVRLAKPVRRKARATHVCVNVDRKLLAKTRENFAALCGMTNMPKGLNVTDEQVITTVLSQLVE